MPNNTAYIEIGSSFGPFYCDAHGLPCAGPDAPGAGTAHPAFGKAIATAMNTPDQGDGIRMAQLVWFNIEEFRSFCALADCDDGLGEEVGYVDILNVGYLWLDTDGRHHYEPPEFSYRESLFGSEEAPCNAVIPGGSVFFLSKQPNSPVITICHAVADAVNPETGEYTLRGWHGAFEKTSRWYPTYEAALKAYRREKRDTRSKNHQDSGDKPDNE